MDSEIPLDFAPQCRQNGAMTTPAEQLCKLLNYVVEQSKEMVKVNFMRAHMRL